MALIKIDFNGVEVDPHGNYGPRLRTMLNGVKHTADSFAKLYGLDPNYLEAVMRQEEPLTPEIIHAVERHSPLNVRDLLGPEYRDRYPVQDDTIDGVVIYTATQRMKTERTFERGPKDGKKVPFYVYADTAMSKMSPFRPEWIKELYIHDGIDPNAPDWAFNNGHFEYQMTFFIGPVNFHWIDKEGRKHVRQMNTGDTNYITPYVRHSFTTRKRGEGLILAVTYGGAVATENFQSGIQSMSLDEYLASIQQQLPTIDQKLATDELNGVIVKRRQNASVVQNADYSVASLVDRIPFQPFTKALEYIVKGGIDKRDLDLQVDAERWGYNIGDVPVLLLLGNRQHLLESGSSFFIQPNVSHAFRNPNPVQGRLVVMEIKPEVGDTLKDLTLICKYSGEEGLKRVHSETKQWF